jgi:hypothetical protein
MGRRPAVGGTYVLWVELWQDDGSVPGNDYELGLLLSPAVPNCATGDYFEDNDTSATAAPVIPGAASGLSVCPSDDDFYAINLSALDEITIDLFFEDAEGDIDLRLYNPFGNVVANSSTGTDDENLTHTVLIPGVWIIRVYLFSDSGLFTGNSYGVQVEVN